MWSWSYGSWIFLYNYMCNQYTNVVRSNPVHGEVYSIQHYGIKCSVTCGRSVVFTGYSCFLNQQNWQPRDNWKIDESGVKHHKPKPKYIKHLRFWKLAGYIYKTNFKGRLKHFRNLQINIDPTFLYFLKKHFARYFFLYKFLNIRHSADVCLD